MKTTTIKTFVGNINSFLSEFERRELARERLTVKQLAALSYESTRGAPRPLTYKWCLAHAKNLHAARAKARKAHPIGQRVIVDLGKGSKAAPHMYADENGAIGEIVAIRLGQWDDCATAKVRIVKLPKPVKGAPVSRRDSRVRLGAVVSYTVGTMAQIKKEVE